MECKQCGKTYQKITSHWALSECDYPKISEELHEVLAGILMGDGTMCDRFDDKRNPRLRITMTNKQYLEELYGNYSLWTGKPRVHQTAEQLAEKNHENSFTDSNDPEDFKTQYHLQTISHPGLERYQKWYNTGKKVFPKDIELSPKTLKHWYVCDGAYNNNGSRRYLSIYCANERKNKEKINRMFEEKGFTDYRWNETKTKTGSWGAAISFTVDETQNLFGYMGEAPKGFEYKWPE